MACRLYVFQLTINPHSNEFFYLAVNQAYVSKFLRGDLFDLSENGRMAICRWYIRYKKIVQSMGNYTRFFSYRILNRSINDNSNDH